MEIKICAQADLEELVFIANHSYRDHYTYLWFDNGDEYVESNFSYAKLKEELANPNSIFFLIYFENNIVGYFKLNLNKDFKDYVPSDTLELQRLYFIDKVVGKGLGTKAMQYVIDYAKSYNKKLLWLTSMDSSRSVDFYKKFDFFISHEYQLNFPAMKDAYRKILVMCKEM